MDDIHYIALKSIAFINWNSARVGSLSSCTCCEGTKEKPIDTIHMSLLSDLSLLFL